MKVAEAHIYSNHPFVVVGSAEPFEGAVSLGPADAAVSDARHALIAVVAQVRLVRIRLWEGACISRGKLVVSRSLDLGRTVRVGDAAGRNRYELPLESPGPTNLSVLVDNPGRATCVDVVINGADSDSRPTDIAAMPLPRVHGEAPPPGSFDELDLILADTDQPVRRLAAALKLMLPGRELGGFSSGRKQLSYWLLAATVVSTLDEADDLSASAERGLSAIDGQDPDGDLVSLATRILTGRL